MAETGSSSINRTVPLYLRRAQTGELVGGSISAGEQAQSLSLVEEAAVSIRGIRQTLRGFVREAFRPFQ